MEQWAESETGYPLPTEPVIDENTDMSKIHEHAIPPVRRSLIAMKIFNSPEAFEKCLCQALFIRP